MKLDVLEIAKPQEKDYFIFGDSEIELDTTMRAVIKLENFTKEYRNFETFSPLLDKLEDEEFLRIIVKDIDDATWLLLELKNNYSLEAAHLILLKLFNFWNDRTFKGTKLNQEQTTKKQ
ncbi:hypothetical protein [Mycoplasmopsis felis]|uniref:hypothetical protein n=1 Tax=Mycoplasmopsis felis TaxID=33923 RepID=UPI002AFE7644|nr:hypothetical protein [Mycoplasmopsis felis]WQQ04496.1 hypothetical protein RRG55_02855 [Mycoplasmopsis felis]